MANKPLNTAILDRAIIFAVRAHTGTEGLATGVYVLRLINGENVKTQKIVIR